MRDRLTEMLEMAGMEEGRIKRNSANTSGNSSTFMPLLQRNRHESFEQFLEKMEEMRHNLANLNNDRDLIKKVQIDILSKEPEAKKNRELHAHVDRFIQRARIFREKLMEMNADLVNYPDEFCGTSRARHEQVKVMMVSFEKVMMNFNEDQMEYKEKSSRRIADYLRLQNIEVTEEQIDEAVESGNLYLLTKKARLGFEEKKVLYEDVKSRANDLLILEKQIREIADLFHDMHLLVVSQGETIDRIETSVQNATEYAEHACVNVKEAVIIKRRGKKMKIICLILIVVLILFLLIIFQSLICFYTPIC